ncbi:proteoglycan 4-like [Plutella xylostella]|uniref:proteoglycan 4-like n=1 Tax=Plutella xylostella TaxID=51655 RepID=UPI00203289E4|nr:proteoglycan 4-like [Plutella xylostella]
MKRNKVPPDDATAHEPEDMPGTPDGTTSEDDPEEPDPEQASTQNDSTPKHLKTNTRESTPKSPSHKTPKCLNICTNIKAAQLQEHQATQNQPHPPTHQTGQTKMNPRTPRPQTQTRTKMRPTGKNKNGPRNQISHPDTPKVQSPKQPPNRTKPPTHPSPLFSDDAPNTTVDQTNLYQAMISSLVVGV